MNSPLTYVPNVNGSGSGTSPITGAVETPSGIPNATSDLQLVISNGIMIAFVIATIVVLFFLILGAFQWITSGGDKEKINKARGTIVNALIGLALLALAFLIVNVIATILGLNTLSSFCIPTLLTKCA